MSRRGGRLPGSPCSPCGTGGVPPLWRRPGGLPGSSLDMLQLCSVAGVQRRAPAYSCPLAQLDKRSQAPTEPSEDLSWRRPEAPRMRSKPRGNPPPTAISAVKPRIATQRACIWSLCFSPRCCSRAASLPARALSPQIIPPRARPPSATHLSGRACRAGRHAELTRCRPFVGRRARARLARARRPRARASRGGDELAASARPRM